MKPLLRIDFADFWSYFNKEDNPFIKWFSTHFEVVLDSRPDLLIYSGYGTSHLTYQCHKLFYNGENARINWGACDYALSFDYLNHPRHFRLPNWFLYDDCRKLLNPVTHAEQILASKKGFCNMVVTNPWAEKRIDFFHKLSAYQPVASGGKYLNNTGGPVADKRSFIRNYKFTIAFENSSYPGYTTEKLVEPLLEHSIPIYWGNPEVGRDFNTKAFVNWHDFGSDDAVINFVRDLDRNDALYLAMLREPRFNLNQLPDCVNEDLIVGFLKRVVEDSKSRVPVTQTWRWKKYQFSLQLGRVDNFFNRHLGYRKPFR